MGGYGRNGKMWGRNGEVCWDVGGAEKCGGEHTHSSTSFPTPSTLTRHLFPRFHTHPTPLPHTHLTRLSTLTSHLPTLSHTFPHLSSPTPTLTTPDIFPSSPPTLPHNLHASISTSPYFIIYPTSKFLSYCQISVAIT